MTESTPQGADGLEGVVAVSTRLSHIDGDKGELTIAGYPAADVAELTFEAVSYLLLFDHLPSPTQERTWRGTLARKRALHGATLSALAAAATGNSAHIDALRLGVSAAACQTELDVEDLLAQLPSILAAFLRLRHGKPVVQAPPTLRRAEAFLFEAEGTVPDPARAAALDTYWNTVCEHGLNASTFVARIITSTRSDAASAVEGALGALKGPLHGGAPGPVLDALLELEQRGGDLSRVTTEWVERQVASGKRIMGFGHRVYQTRDPRAEILESACERLLAHTQLLSAARVHEAAVLQTLHRLKPGRRVATNVEFYTALLLHGLGFAPETFSAIFALGRSAGWLAHYREQRANGRLIRPRAAYVGGYRRR